MSQSPITVTYPLEQVLGEINQKLDGLKEDVNDLKVGQARLEEEVKSIKEDVKELKGSTKAQIWTLIGILVTVVVATTYRFVITAMSNHS